jgi:exonuclease III
VLVIVYIMRVATFNVENLFNRVRELNADTQTNKQVMEDATCLQELIGKETCSPQEEADMKQILKRNRRQCI